MEWTKKMKKKEKMEKKSKPKVMITTKRSMGRKNSAMARKTMSTAMMLRIIAIKILCKKSVMKMNKPVMKKSQKARF